MKKLLYILLIVGMYSCDDYLDVTPKGKVIPTKIEDYRLLLDNLDMDEGINNSYSLSMIASDDIAIPDEMARPGFLYTLARINAYKFLDEFYLPHEEDVDYKHLYRQIYLANTIITDLQGLEGDTAPLIAEAKVHRAYAFLSLVNLYAKHFDASTASEDLGVPIILKPQFEDVDLSRKSVEEVYNQVIKDLNEAIDDLPDFAEYNFRPSKPAAYGLLARTYLYQNNMTEALKYADLALKINNHLLDFNDMSAGYPKNLDNNENLLLKVTGNHGLKVPYADIVLKESYSPFNMKGAMFFMGDFIFGTSGILYIELLVTGDAPNVGVTVPEMYYIKAEAHAKMGDADLAMQAVNTVRKTRILSSYYADLSASSTEEAVYIVKQERRKELAFRGLRYFDLKRYNLYDGDNITITHDLEGVTYELEPGDNKWVFPIAQKYIDLNPEIEQNPR